MTRPRLASLACAGIYLLFSAASGAPVQAGQKNSVPVIGLVELFTSQGCSSCPPADKLLKTYVDRPDTIALTLPVDYWDYLGWKDTFSSPRNSQRQRDYALTRGDGAVYTPQAVINGRLHVTGSNEKEINRTIKKLNRETPMNVPVTIVSEGGKLIIDIGAAQDGTDASGDATIWVAVVQKEALAEIRDGENSGRKLTYYNLVRDVSAVGVWDGAPKQIRLSRKSVMWEGTERCVVLVQQGPGGPILGAAAWTAD